jgi:hypothetical protein
MSDFKLKTPVAFLIFNRPELTKQVFARIRQVQPPKLLIIADGPRIGRQDDAAKCSASRAIVSSIDWDCEVLRNYSDSNMGLKLREAS